jgi:hypothetical protein
MPMARTRRAQAIRDGRDAGEAAAASAHDGNTEAVWYEWVYRGIYEGDPAVLDAFRLPDLSGEWAGDPTPATMAQEWGLNESNDRDGSILDDLCTLYIDAADRAFWWELSRACKRHLGRTAVRRIEQEVMVSGRLDRRGG